MVSEFRQPMPTTPQCLQLLVFIPVVHPPISILILLPFVPPELAYYHAGYQLSQEYMPEQLLLLSQTPLFFLNDQSGDWKPRDKFTICFESRKILIDCRIQLFYNSLQLIAYLLLYFYHLLFLSFFYCPFLFKFFYLFLQLKNTFSIYLKLMVVYMSDEHFLMASLENVGLNLGCSSTGFHFPSHSPIFIPIVYCHIESRYFFACKGGCGVLQNDGQVFKESEAWVLPVDVHERRSKLSVELFQLLLLHLQFCGQFFGDQIVSFAIQHYLQFDSMNISFPHFLYIPHCQPVLFSVHIGHCYSFLNQHKVYYISYPLYFVEILFQHFSHPIIVSIEKPIYIQESGMSKLGTVFDIIINISTMQATPESKIIGEEMMNINRMFDWTDGSSCSYCEKGTSYSWGFTNIMHPYTYELLMETGWRRCGTYYYNKDLIRSCCKQWKPHQDVTKFRIKKGQKKTVRKMFDLIFGAQENQKASFPKPKEKPVQNEKIANEVNQDKKNIMRSFAMKVNQSIKSDSKVFLHGVEQKYLTEENISQKLELDGIIHKLKYFASKPNSKSDYYCNYVMLLFGLNKKNFTKDYILIQFVKNVKQFIESLASGENYFVQVERGGYLLFNDEKKLKNEKELQTVKMVESKKKKVPEKQIEVQKEEMEEMEEIRRKITITSDEIVLGRLRIRLMEVDQKEESWKLYQKYCAEIHQKPEKSMSSYVNFLAKKGLKYIQEETTKPCEKAYSPSWETEKSSGDIISGKRTKRMGCFHMKYYLQDRLIGVGVVDIVPDGLCSVYFFYDPQYKDYRFGVFSSLIEIQYIRWLQLSFPEFTNYYMGSYLQDNHKMSYKVDYEPTSLLCPITYNFIEFTPDLRERIEKIITKEVESVRIAPENMNKKADMDFTQDTSEYINSKIKLKYQNMPIKLSDITPEGYEAVMKYLREYLTVWGKEVFQNFTFTF